SACTAAYGPWTGTDTAVVDAATWLPAGAVLFFFSSRRRHTRFSRDWSSDVCSSDLRPGRRQALRLRRPRGHRGGGQRVSRRGRRSEERRVGKECRSRWSPHHREKREGGAGVLCGSSERRGRRGTGRRGGRHTKRAGM